jgi:outer membrane immunogenic protein
MGMLRVKTIHRKLTNLIFLSTTAAVAPFAAQAADIYRAPAPVSYKDAPAYVPPNTWAGFYVGINGGYGWGGSGNSIQYNDGGLGDLSKRATPEGGFGGGQIGYNFQSGSFVYGVETDFQGADISGSARGTTTVNGFDYNTRDRVDWFGTVRGRLGYAFDRTLIYGTGGFAYGNVNQRASLSDGVSVSNNNTQTGYVVGGGIEYKINPSWSMKAEYQYIDLGTAKLTGTDGVNTNALDTNFNTARVGLNYRLGRDYEPLK